MGIPLVTPAFSRATKLLIPSALASVAVSILPIFLGYRMEQIVEDVQLSNARITLAREIISARRDIELGLRGYALSQDPKYLESYYSGRITLTQQILPEYLTTTPLKRLQASSLARIKEIDDRVMQVGVPRDGNLRAIVLESKETLDAAKRFVNETITREQRFVGEQREQLRTTLTATRIALAIGGFSNFCLLIFLYISIRQEYYKDLEKAATQILLTANSTHDAVK